MVLLPPSNQRTRALGHFIAAGIALFLAARLGLALLSTPSGVAVFWPASGVAAGILMAFGRRARPALVMGVVAGTVAANLLSDGNLWTAVFEGICNAAEAVLLVWLLERWFGPAFAFRPSFGLCPGRPKQRRVAWIINKTVTAEVGFTVAFRFD